MVWRECRRDSEDNSGKRLSYARGSSKGVLVDVFFLKQETAYEIMPSLVGSEMCVTDSLCTEQVEGL